MTIGNVRAGLHALTQVKPRYDEGEIYYLGNTTEVFLSTRVQRLLGRNGRRFRVNFARTPVDVLLERTEIAGLSCPDELAQAYLEGVWEDNQLGLEAKDIHRMVFEFGDAYLIAQPDEDEPNGISAYSHDPRNVRVFYDPARPRRKSHAVHRWYEAGDGENGMRLGELWLRVNLYYPDRTEMYVATDPVDPSFGIVDVRDLQFRQFDEVDNPSNLLPVFHFRNGRPYGRPEHADAMPIQDMINKTLATAMGSMEAAGFPQRWILENDSPAAASAFEQAMTPTESSTEPPMYEAGPASTFMISGKATGQYSVAPSSNFLELVHSLIQQMAAVTDVPMHYFDLTGGMPSGESYRAANGPLDKKVEHNQALLGVTWREFFEYCLAVNGVPGADAQIEWKPAETFTDKDSWEAAKLQLEAGVPFEQVARERGYAPDLIDEWMRRRDVINSVTSGIAQVPDDPAQPLVTADPNQPDLSQIGPSA